MPLAPFHHSAAFTFGVELEIQIVNTHDYDLTKAASDLMRLVGEKKAPGDIKPEITESMIELATGICLTHAQALHELSTMRDMLVDAADQLNVGLCGGGTHAFQKWSERQIFDSPRFHYISELYGYLAKQFTVFGQHVHIGCPDADQALYLLHAMARYIPHFIALSASSPFVQGVDTGFDSARLNSVFAFPLSGRAPFTLRWHDFEAYFEKMLATGMVEGMKDFYWDIRPKPEFGTIEIRVMDTPLTIDRAAAIAAYIQTLARYLLLERPVMPDEDDYLVYTFNRFEACRFGLEGRYAQRSGAPDNSERLTIGEDILLTLKKLAPHAAVLESEAALQEIRAMATNRTNHAGWLRQQWQQNGTTLNEVVRQQCLQWRGTC